MKSLSPDQHHLALVLLFKQVILFQKQPLICLVLLTCQLSHLYLPSSWITSPIFSQYCFTYFTLVPLEISLAQFVPAQLILCPIPGVNVCIYVCTDQLFLSCCIHQLFFPTIQFMLNCNSSLITSFSSLSLFPQNIFLKFYGMKTKRR